MAFFFFFSLFVACRLLLEREVDEGPEGALLNVLISALRSSSGPCSLLPIILCISIYAHLFFFFSFNLVVTHISSSFQREYSCMPWSIHHHDFRLSLVFTLFFFRFSLLLMRNEIIFRMHYAYIRTSIVKTN